MLFKRKIYRIIGGSLKDEGDEFAVKFGKRVSASPRQCQFSPLASPSSIEKNGERMTIGCRATTSAESNV